MIELIKSGGKTMIFLFLTSFVALGYIIEKFLNIHFERKKLGMYRKLVENPSLSLEDITKRVKKDDATIAFVLKSVIECKDLSREENIELTHSILRHELSRLEKGIEVIEISASISPLLGLLGTVIGLLEIFTIIAQKGASNPSDLSGGIAKALITTVAGLIIAIPSYAAHSYFSKKYEDLAIEIDKYAILLVSRIYGARNNV
jgi:biopolymer transport protein ExbB